MRPYWLVLPGPKTPACLRCMPTRRSPALPDAMDTIVPIAQWLLSRFGLRPDALPGRNKSCRCKSGCDRSARRLSPTDQAVLVETFHLRSRRDSKRLSDDAADFLA